MAYVQPQFDPSFDPGQPAFLAFWSGFLGQRTQMNQMAMQQRLQQQAFDRQMLAKEEASIRDSIAKLANARARLEQTMAAASAKAGTQDYKKMMDIVNLLVRIDVAQEGHAATLGAARVAAGSRMAVERLDKESNTRAKLDEGASIGTEAAKKAMSDPRFASLDDRGKATLMAAKLDAELGDIDRESPRGVGAARAARDYMSGVEAGGAGAATRFDSSRFKGGIDKRVEMLGVNDEQYLKDYNQALSHGYLGGGGGLGDTRKFLLSMLGQAMGGTMTGDVQGEAGVVGTVAPALQPRSASASASVKAPAGLGQIDDLIKEQKAELRRVQAERAAQKPANLFEGFVGNYLIETSFVRPPQGLEHTATLMGQATPEELAMARDVLLAADGDPAKALQMLQSGQGPAFTPAPTGVKPAAPEDVAQGIQFAESIPTMEPELAPSTPTITPIPVAKPAPVTGAGAAPVSLSPEPGVNTPEPIVATQQTLEQDALAAALAVRRAASPDEAQGRLNVDLAEKKRRLQDYELQITGIPTQEQQGVLDGLRRRVKTLQMALHFVDQDEAPQPQDEQMAPPGEV